MYSIALLFSHNFIPNSFPSLLLPCIILSLLLSILNSWILFEFNSCLWLSSLHHDWDYLPLLYNYRMWYYEIELDTKEWNAWASHEALRDWRYSSCSLWNWNGHTLLCKFNLLFCYESSFIMIYSCLICLMLLSAYSIHIMPYPVKQSSFISWWRNATDNSLSRCTMHARIYLIIHCCDVSMITWSDSPSINWVYVLEYLFSLVSSLRPSIEMCVVWIDATPLLCPCLTWFPW